MKKTNGTKTLASEQKPASAKTAPSMTSKNNAHLPEKATSKATTSLPKIAKTSTSQSSNASTNGKPLKKRPRSISRSESPPPKRRAVSTDRGDPNISEQIWELFGKKRDSYVNRDVFSDDEDMEADALVLEREEKLSSRIAKREEQEELEAERRHEEEKRRRRKDKGALERRG